MQNKLTFDQLKELASLGAHIHLDLRDIDFSPPRPPEGPLGRVRLKDGVKSAELHLWEGDDEKKPGKKPISGNLLNGDSVVIMAVGEAGAISHAGFYKADVSTLAGRNGIAQGTVYAWLAITDDIELSKVEG